MSSYSGWYGSAAGVASSHRINLDVASLAGAREGGVRQRESLQSSSAHEAHACQYSSYTLSSIAVSSLPLALPSSCQSGRWVTWLMIREIGCMVKNIRPCLSIDLHEEMWVTRGWSVLCHSPLVKPGPVIGAGGLACSSVAPPPLSCRSLVAG